MGAGPLFLVEVREPDQETFEVFIDCDGSTPEGKPRHVSVEDCISLTRAIRGQFEEDDLDDCSLTVSSAGIGQPLRTLRQYLKLVGRPVEVALKSGRKMTATLEAADETSITLDGTQIPLTEIKTTKEHIDFK